MAKRQAFSEEIKTIPRGRLLFIDEFGCNLGMIPRYGRAPSGERVHILRPRDRGRNITVAGVMSAEETLVLAPLPGSATITNFLWFVSTVLTAVLRPDDVVVLDNLRAHRNEAVVAAIEATGAKVMFLPPYSPDMNPIEECWSKVKNHLRKAMARTQEALFDALQSAIDTVTGTDITGWVRHAGYAA